MNSTHTRPSLRLLIAATAVLALLGLLIAGFLESSKDETTGLAAPKTARDDVSAKRSTGTPESGSSIAVAPEPNPPTDDFAPGERERRVERSASITLAAPEDNLDEAARGVARVAERRRGFITSSTLSTGEDGANGGTFELRVPSRELSAAMADLGDLGSVRERTQSSQDVTQGFVSTEDQLVRGRAERKSLLRRLERADSDREARALRRQLDLASAEVRRLQGELRRLRERTGFASISVTLEKDGDAVSAGGGIEEGLDDLTASLLASVNIALRILGVLIPVGLLVLVCWTTYRWRMRRRSG